MAEARRRFRFVKELAQGGFGKVYLAEMLTGENFSSVVAVKLLHARWTENAEVVMRSRDEARLLGRLRHRNIVRVESLSRIQGQVAIVMEYLEGADLKTISNALRDSGRSFPRQAAFESVGSVADALDAAYNQVPLNAAEPLRVIHRDIKPSNVMLTVEGDVKVLDFGTARASFDTREAKTQALAFGSAAYMSPERLMGDEDTPAADVFALGLTLWELLTQDSFGKIPVRPEKFEAQVAERLEQVDLSSMPAYRREQVLEALRLMLAYEPGQRPGAADVTELMETFAESCRDGGLKRFSREVVRDVVARNAPEEDPDDPFTGQLLQEDTSTLSSDASGVHARGGWAQEDVPSDVSGVSSAGAGGHPPATPPVPEPSEPPPVEVAPPVAPNFGPRPAARPLTSAHTMIPDDEPADDGATSVLSASRPTPPAPEPATASDMPAPHPAVTPSIVASPAASRPDAATTAPKGGGKGPAIAVGALVVLALAAGGAWVARGDGAEAPPVAAPAAAPVGAAAGEPVHGGDSAPDLRPNAKGRGGVILSVPGGAERVDINLVGGSYRTAWDGTAYLNLRDLEPGTLRVKLTPKGGRSGISTVPVKADQTCRYVYTPGQKDPWVAEGACQ
jgi:serine/threonine protein kinase